MCAGLRLDEEEQKVMSRTTKSLLSDDSIDAVENPGTENGLLTQDTPADAV